MDDGSALATPGVSAMIVVDLKRHYDGENGLVGPFNSRDEAQSYIDGLPDRFVREYAAIRPVAPI